MSNVMCSLDLSKSELLEKLAKTEIPNELDTKFDWVTYNKEIEKLSEPEVENKVEVSDEIIIKSISNIVEKYLYIDQLPFSFKGRHYLRGLYDLVKEYPTGCRNQIWHCGRQIEKTVVLNSQVLMADGTIKLAKDIKIGDVVASIDTDTFKSCYNKISWVSSIYSKPTYKIKTRHGAECVVGEEHPLLIENKWTEIKNIQLNQKVGEIRKWKMITTETSEVEIHWARIAGWMISEGGMKQKSWVFTNSDKNILSDFAASFVVIYPKASWKIKSRKGIACFDYRLHKHTTDFLRQRLESSSSFEKKIPDWIWKSSLEVKANFVNRLWGGDGYCKKEKENRYLISYCSVSKNLIKDLKLLLLQFGIPSHIRSFVPTLYKGTNNKAWELRILTRQGWVDFIQKIGAFGKSESIKLEFDCEENNNLDVLPKEEIQKLINETRQELYSKNIQLDFTRKFGLKWNLCYPPTKIKLQKYVDAFISLGLNVEKYQKWFSADIYWDEVKSIEFTGVQECVDFTVENTHTFIIDGIITHNSTSQACKSIALGIAYPPYKSLYVAPRFDQVTVFSQQRFKPICEESIELQNKWINPHITLWQVGAKQFLNGSFFNFRSCYLSADNSRGISAQHLMIDEIQDIVSDAVPILEQCQSHATKELKFNTYAGTPKTNSNVITRRFKNSCQLEWLIPCSACQHWNYQDDSIVGEKSFVCVKCNKEIFPVMGQWVPMRPELLDKTWGFRIPQIMAPFKTHADIVATRIDPQVSRRQYFNECLGLPYDEGELVLVEKNLIEACAAGDGQGMWPANKAYNMARHGTKFFMGVDYGSAEGEQPSFTVISIGYITTAGRYHVIYMEKLVGEKANLALQPAYINEVAAGYGVTWIGGDWGFGAPLNQRLITEYGWPRYDARNLLLEFQYVKQKTKAAWNNNAQRYMIDRSTAMSDLIDDIRNKKVTFFKYEALRPFVNDFITIFIEFDDDRGTMKYDHEMPDDAFHSVNYGYLACLQYYGKLVNTVLPDIGHQDPDTTIY